MNEEPETGERQIPALFAQGNIRGKFKQFSRM
jgi:hypothetical protein